jgi:hypothetical protein
MAAFLLSLSFAAAARAGSGWAQLKAGMSYAEAVTALGQPLLRSKGREFELWIYDRGAEVVYFRGTVVAWTAPNGAAVLGGEQIDLRGVFQRAAATPPPPPKPVYVPRAEAGYDYGYERVPLRRLRFRRW